MGVALVVLMLGLLAAHHAGLHDFHGAAAGPDHMAMAMAHGDSAPAAPAPSVEETVGMCLAVLPLVLAMLLAVGIAVLLARVWNLAVRHGPPICDGVGLGPLRPARAGPRLLCVMRC